MRSRPQYLEAPMPQYSIAERISVTTNCICLKTLSAGHEAAQQGERGWMNQEDPTMLTLVTYLIDLTRSRDQ